MSLQLLLALPITVISGNFATMYAEQELNKMEKRDGQLKQNAKKSLPKSLGVSKRWLSFGKSKAAVVESDQQEVAGSSFGVWQESVYLEGEEVEKENKDGEEEVAALSSEQRGGLCIRGEGGSHHVLNVKRRDGEFADDEGQPRQNGGWTVQRLTRGNTEARGTTEARPACSPARGAAGRDGRDGDWRNLQDARACVHVVGANFGAAGARG